MKVKHVTILIAVFFLSLVKQVSAQEQLYPGIFPLKDVVLLDGPFKHACELNIQTLLTYDVDRLLAPYRKEAGLPEKALSFDNWIGLDGHIGGHYLSALAIHWASTGNEECRERMEYMIKELKECQEKHGNGYVGGVPDGMSIWNEIKSGKPEAAAGGWVPWYNIHKIFAGLRDAWLYGGNEEAKEMFLKLCDWGLTIIEPFDEVQMEQMLDTEFGGMNENYADAYQMTGEEKYLNAAKRFSHKVIFENMAKKIDNLDNMHANTQVPKAVGYQRVAELTGDDSYITASEFFWQTVVNNRSLSLGGNSRNEHFPSASACISYTEDRNGPESCNTYNMLKLAEGLFRMNPDAAYTDYYERALFNHILSTQHPEHGGYVYFTSARPRHYRVYSAPNQAMWCCVGTGMENHGKYGEFIYTSSEDNLYVNLFIASELNWREKGIKLAQHTSFPYEEESKITVTTKEPATFSLLVRFPAWVNVGEMEVICGGKNYAIDYLPSSYVKIERTWNDGDEVKIRMPMHISIEEMPHVANYISFLYGPILLGAKTGNEGLTGLIAGEDRWAHQAEGSLLPLTEAPLIIGERKEILEIANNMHPVEGKPLSFTAPDLFWQDDYRNLVLEPFYGIHDSRYMMYWQSMAMTEYEQAKAEQERIEKEKIELDNRTVDFVAPGEQQPEVDHRMQADNSHSGFSGEQGWRDARDGGFFSYNLLTQQRTDLKLLVRYWGNETGNRTFHIYLDEELLVTENLVNKWNKEEFINVEYNIPTEMLQGKESVTVRFQGIDADQVAGGIFYVRLLTPFFGENSKSNADYYFEQLDLGVTYVTADIQLPQSESDNFSISWASSNNSLINENGKVNRPAVGSGDQEVILTARLESQGKVVEKSFTVTVAEADYAYLLSYILSGNSERTNAFHLACSKDGNNYTALNNGKAILYPLKGTKKLRSPGIFRKSDGSFGVIAADDNNSSSVIIFQSEDLIDYTDERLLELNPNGIRVSYPECKYNNLLQSYVITWKGSDNKWYQSLTKDFLQVISTTQLEDYTQVTVSGSFPENATEASLLPITYQEYERLIRKYGRIINTGIAPLEAVTVRSGEELILPDRVVAEYSDGSSKSLGVIWDREAISKVDLTKPGRYTIQGVVQQPEYASPFIRQRADPWVTKGEDGYYYFTASYPMLHEDDPEGYDRVILRRATTIEGLKDAEEISIWDESNCSSCYRYVWAPEIHQINGTWFVFFTTSVDNNVWSIRPRVIVCSLGEKDPFNPECWEDVGHLMEPTAGDNVSFTGFSLDMTHFENKGVYYVVWAQTIGHSSLAIASVDKDQPWKTTSGYTLLTSPEYAWEWQNDWVNEGPAIIKNNGKIYLAFSASSVNHTYCVGLLYADEDADLLDINSWTKVKYPLLSTDDLPEDQNGPGHNSFTIDEYGNPVIVYHARNPEETIDGGLYDPGRHAFVKSVNFAFDGTPVLNMSAEQELASENKEVFINIVVTD